MEVHLWLGFSFHVALSLSILKRFNEFDVIRDILRERLSESEYAVIRDRVRDYFYQQSGRDDG